VNASQLRLDGPKRVIQQLSASFNNFSVKSTPGERAKPSLIKKTHWVIHDRKKFETLIYDAKAYIDSLQEITKNLQAHTIQHQQEIMTSGIRRINDTRALEWLSEVCGVDYPELSDAATSKTETITQVSIPGKEFQDQRTNKGFMSENDDDSDALSLTSVITSLEDMTVTELKHELSTFRLRAKRRGEEAASRGKKSRDEPQKPPDDDEPEEESSSVGTKVLKSSQPENKNKATRVAGTTKASGDQEFHEEMVAVVRWFTVLSLEERACSLLCFEQCISINIPTW
jgi:hypothetical protein